MENIMFHSINDVLQFAIEEEQKAIRTYSNKAQQTTSFEQRTLWEQLARDEMRHKAIITNILEQVREADKKIDFNIELFPPSSPLIEDDDSQYSEVIAEVISSEEQAYKMYTDLANLAENEEIKKILSTIASEEKIHKDILINELSIETNL